MVLKSWSTDRWIKLSLAIHVLVPQVKVILLHCEVLIAASTFWACYPTAALNEMVHNSSKVRRSSGMLPSWYGNHHRNVTVYRLCSCSFNSER